MEEEAKRRRPVVRAAAVAVAVLQDVQIAAGGGDPGGAPGIGKYIRLGPLGTALLPALRPPAEPAEPRA
ncbi:hypothetical protein GCM10009678_81120 [Actinomadura kijaniata]|uniref:hypothetical protein n=1 Tax=Actinomadura kijaniata TaxID=46161 RepID=UPI002FE7AA92